MVKNYFGLTSRIKCTHGKYSVEGDQYQFHVNRRKYPDFVAKSFAILNNKYFVLKSQSIIFPVGLCSLRKPRQLTVQIVIKL